MKKTWMHLVGKSSTALLATALLVPALACGKSQSGGAPAAEPAAQAAAPVKREMGAETPEALVERMKKAAASKDVAEMAACMSPKSRTEMAMGMYLGATMMVAFSEMGLQMGDAMGGGMADMMSDEDKKKAQESMEKGKAEVAQLKERYNAMVGKYGLPKLPAEGEAEPDMPKEEAEKLFASIDQGAFVADVMKFLESMPGEDKPSADEAAPVKIPEGPLENFQVAGDTATGSVGGEALNFVKVDGRWFIEMPEPTEGVAETE